MCKITDIPFLLSKKHTLATEGVDAPWKLVRDAVWGTTPDLLNKNLHFN